MVEYFEAAEGVIVALSALGGLVFGWFKWSKERSKRLQAENEIKFNRAALQFPDFVHEWDHIGAELANLVETTEVDRILILRAWNGTLEPRWTTAVYQLRQGAQSPISYVHFELDSDYVDRIRQVVQKGSGYWEVHEMPDSAIRSVYEAEGVKSSFWSHIDSVRTDDHGSTGITYASFSSHEGPLSPETQTKCRILTGRLKGLAAYFTEVTS